MKQKGYMLLESIISLAVISIISFTMLSIAINSCIYVKLGEDKIHMTSIAQEYVEKIKNSNLESIVSYKEKSFTYSGYNVNTDIKYLDNLKNCIKISVNVAKDNEKVLIESYKVIN